MIVMRSSSCAIREGDATRIKWPPARVGFRVLVGQVSEPGHRLQNKVILLTVRLFMIYCERNRAPNGRRTAQSENDPMAGGDCGTLRLWMAVSPFVYGAGDTLLWNNVVVGLAILVAGYNAYRPSNGEMPHVGAASFVAILGLWMILSPFMMAGAVAGLLWSNVVAGIIVVAAAGYNAYASQQVDTAPTGTRV